MADKADKNGKDLEDKMNPLFEKAQKRYEEALDQSPVLDHYVRSAYDGFVSKYKLEKKNFVVGDKQKDELIDEIINGLKNEAIHLGKVKVDKEGKPIGVSEELWEEAILPAYFGISREKLKEMWKNKKRITKEDVDHIINVTSRTLVQKLAESALKDIDYGKMKPGTAYLGRLNKEYNLGLDLKDVREVDDLKGALGDAYSAIHAQRLRKYK